MALTSAERSANYRAKDVEAYKKKKAEQARTPENRAKRTAYMRKWREENREKHNQQARESHERNKHKHRDKARSRYLMREYGITLEQKIAMIDAQNGKCAICEKEFRSPRSTHLDHCHKTGVIRGILCHECNTRLGWFEAYSTRISEYVNRQKVP